VDAEHHEQATEGDVLSDHHSQLEQFPWREVLPQLGHERIVHQIVVERHALGELDGQILARLQLALAARPIEPGDARLVESLTRRRRVAGEASSRTRVESRDAQARELLDARRHHSPLVSRVVEVEVAGEEAGEMREHRVHRGVAARGCVGLDELAEGLGQLFEWHRRESGLHGFSPAK
jgi:hypothetical protein